VNLITWFKAVVLCCSRRLKYFSFGPAESLKTLYSLWKLVFLASVSGQMRKQAVNGMRNVRGNSAL